MTGTLTTISTRDLLSRLREGERDFSSTRLSSGETALQDQEGYAELLKYLKEQDLRSEPVNAESSDWSGLKARGLFLPFSKAAGIVLSNADLRGADFRRGDFTGADLHDADLSGAFVVGSRFQQVNLAGATLRGTDFYEASLEGATLSGADLTRAFLLRLTLKDADITGAVLTDAIMYRADLRGIVGLDTVSDLGTVVFHQTIVTAKEQATIEAALRDRPLFDVRTE